MSAERASGSGGSERRDPGAMTQTCARCGAAAGESDRFCSSCGAPLALPEGAERKLATMAFVDLVGSTELATTLDPEDLRGRLAGFFDLASGVLAEHGGRVEKYIGDAVLAVFGVPRSHGDDPDRAVAAALALLEAVAARGDGLAVRIGVETGEVLAADREGNLSVTGPAVNAAARLQAAAAPGEVLVGERAARSSRSAELEPRGPLEAKGFAEPLSAFRALGSGRGAPLAATPFLGRADDLALLRLAYRRAVRQRTPELVMITGEAGIGKTRLAGELLRELGAEPDPPLTLVGRNPPYGRGIAFWALGEILREAAEANDDASMTDVRAGLARRLESLGAADATELAATLAVPLGGEGVGDVADALKLAWRRLVALLAAERPLVIGVDDAHWADDGFLDLIEEVVVGLDGAPLLVLCTSRPELADRRPAFAGSAANATRIELRPLVPNAAAELSAALLPERARPLAARVAEASGGNPFFAEEVTRRIADEPDGALDGDLPDTVQGAIAARLDLLPADEKRAIQHAAVLGSGFLAEALADLLDAPVDDLLEGLVRRALVQERITQGAGRYAFRHQLIRDVAYASLPRAQRARLHEAAAAGILDRAGERYPELTEIVAFHRNQAADLDPGAERRRCAYEATVRAAGTVARRGATARGQELYERAASLADSTAERLDCLRAAADVALRQFRGDQALRLRREEAEVAERAGERGAAAAAYAHAVQASCRMGGITGDVVENEMVAMLRRGRELVADDDAVTRARLLLDEAWIAWRFGRMNEMEAPALAGLELAREVGDPALLSNALDAAGSLEWHAGRYRASLALTRERMELLDGVAEPSHEVEFERADALHMTIETLMQAGELREAAAYADRAREADLARGLAHIGWTRGVLPHFLLGEWDLVLHSAGKGREAWRALGRPPVPALATALAAAGAIHGFRGEEREAEEWFEYGVGLTSGAQKSGIVTLRAEVMLHHGQAQAAAEALPAPLRAWSWWGPPYRAARAEALVRAGLEGADAALAEAEAASFEHPYARAVALRTRALSAGEESPLRESLAILREIESPYQAARTGWLLGGEERAAAARTFGRLRVAPPAD
ncbi:MAG: AAA family ATPase [Solirubrobacterales bacterium]|nr:AAA family ATPase [Solirubrobacterales bacterium]